MTVFLYIIAFLFAFAVLLSIAEILYYLSMRPAPELPDERDVEYYGGIGGKKFAELYLFLSGEEAAPYFSEDEIYDMLFIQSDYMAHRFDCSDFRAQLLFKIYKDCRDRLSEKSRELIKNTFLDFKYFPDEPGDDSMCYWSENHQLLFAVSEYLAGQEWPDEIFSNNGMTGSEHRKKAKKRIDAWMRQRFDFGFSEYLSNNYLAEDIAPMANFIAYSEDKKSAEQMKIIMDILWLDVALNSTVNRFVATSSRMYGNNKMGNFYGNSIQTAMNVLWGKAAAEKALKDPFLSETEKAQIKASLEKKPNHIVICFTDIVKKGIYSLPQVIRDIALYDGSFVSEMSCGLSPKDLKNENLIGHEPHQIMAQWGAEAFTNPEVIENSLSYIVKNKMYRNSFIGYFRFLKLTVLKPVKLSRFAKKHDIVPHGIATGRGNVYTYRTPYYTLSTSVCKDTDVCGAQEHVWSANIGETLSLFTTHPAGNGKGRYGSSPGYWIGNGRRPMSVQHENVNITIYRLPTKKRLGETGIADMTHAYMPKAFYDEAELTENIMFARKNGVFVALISNGKLKYREFCPDSAEGLMKYKGFPEEYRLSGEFDLCSFGGEYHIYVTELSDADKESFEEFKSRIRKNNIRFADGKVLYSTRTGTLSASYSGEFSLDGRPIKTDLGRYSSMFCKSPRKAKEITVSNGNSNLYLCLENAERKQIS